MAYAYFAVAGLNFAVMMGYALGVLDPSAVKTVIDKFAIAALFVSLGFGELTKRLSK